MMQFLVEKLTKFVPVNYRPRFRALFAHIAGKKNSREFRQFLVDSMQADPSLQVSGQNALEEDQIDSALFAWLPLFTYQEIKHRSEKILHHLPGLNEKDYEKLSSVLDLIIARWNSETHFVSAHQLQEICKAALCLSLDATSTQLDYPCLISLTAQKLGYAMPAPVLFADTNWVKDQFAFVVNPGTAKLELWRTDYMGSQGISMSMWKQWVNGSNRERTWGVFTKPYEYKTH